MKYDNYNGWYKWSGIESYTCRKCDGFMDSHKLDLFFEKILYNIFSQF